MDSIQRYLDLQDNYQKFKERKQNPHFSFPTKSSDLSQTILSSAEDNGYSAIELYGDKPKVIVIGFTHKTKKIDQEDQIENILRDTLSSGDIILCEGRGPSEMSYPHYHIDDLFGKLKDYLSSQGIRTLNNDEKMKVANFIVAANHLKRLKDEFGNDYENAAVKEAVADYMKSLDERDINFCDHCATGIIPLIEGTTKNYKKMNPDAKIFQMVGMLHIYNGIVQEKLKEAQIPYIVLAPK
jgi:hypothetical protein